MLLGKRQRPPMKRTTSMTEFHFDLNGAPPSDSSNSAECRRKGAAIGGGGGDGSDQPSRSGAGRKSCDLKTTAHFLTACGLCKRRLLSGRDIFMYRGDSAFCSLECRQQQINQDEKREKLALMASSKKEAPASSAAAAGSLKIPAAKGDTAVAAV